MTLGRWLHKLFGYPWVTAFEVAALRQGDLLVVHLDERIPEDMAERLRGDLEQLVPRGISVWIMLGDGTRLEVVRVEDPAPAPRTPPDWRMNE